jgi:hypothetical protein
MGATAWRSGSPSIRGVSCLSRSASHQIAAVPRRTGSAPRASSVATLSRPARPSAVDTITVLHVHGEKKAGQPRSFNFTVADLAPFEVDALPELGEGEREALKGQIAISGVLAPLELDESGHVLDGWARLQAWRELDSSGKKFPRAVPAIVRCSLDEPSKRLHRLASNLQRRQMTREQRVEFVVRELTLRPATSDALLARVFGLSEQAVRTIRKAKEDDGSIPAARATRTTRLGAVCVPGGGDEERRRAAEKGDRQLARAYLAGAALLEEPKRSNAQLAKRLRVRESSVAAERKALEDAGIIPVTTTRVSSTGVERSVPRVSSPRQLSYTDSLLFRAEKWAQGVDVHGHAVGPVVQMCGAGFALIGVGGYTPAFAGEMLIVADLLESEARGWTTGRWYDADVNESTVERLVKMFDEPVRGERISFDAVAACVAALIVGATATKRSVASGTGLLIERRRSEITAA